jgi:outer membrane protein assembly factor BamB
MADGARGAKGKIVIALCAAAVVVLGFAAEDRAEEWPQFRGVNRDGISTETGLADSWGESGPQEVWRHSIGEGYSAISVVDGRLYTMYGGDQEGEAVEFAAAFDAASGRELWRTPLGEKLDTQFGNGPRSTPTVDGDTVFVLDSTGTFAALAVAGGAERWRVSLPESFGTERPYWGFSTSPLVDGKRVILESGGTEGRSYAAFDKKTGEVVWTVGEGQPGHNSALALELNGTRQYVYFVEKTLTSVDPAGNVLWSHPWPEGETHAMPLFIPPNRIFASGAEGVGAALLEIRKDGDDTVVEEIWKTRFMRNHFSSSILLGDHIYGFDNATLKCISLADGSLAWAKRGLGKGSLILADGHLIVLSDRGDLLLIEATPDGYREKSRVQALEGRCWTAPSLAGGRLYLRNHTEIVSYDVTG